MDKIITSRQFAADFKLVTDHYQLTGQELEDAKTSARSDMENAEICFSDIANRLRRPPPDRTEAMTALTEKIRTQVAQSENKPIGEL